MGIQNHIIFLLFKECRFSGWVYAGCAAGNDSDTRGPSHSTACAHNHHCSR